MCEQGGGSWVLKPLAERARLLAEDIAERERQVALFEVERKSRLQAQMEFRRKMSEEHMLARARRKEARLAKKQSKLVRAALLRAHEDKVLAEAIAKRRAKLAAARIPPAIVEPEPERVVVVPIRVVNDPWTIIRQRHYSKPPLLEGGMRLSPRQLMVGRAR